MADYIDRNAAIEALRKFADDCPGSTEAATAAAMAISVLSRLPGPWNDMESNPPSEDGPYLCKYGHMIKQSLRFPLVPYAVRNYYAADANHHFEFESLLGVHVTHWMPLPDEPEVGK